MFELTCVDFLNEMNNNNKRRDGKHNIHMPQIGINLVDIQFVGWVNPSIWIRTFDFRNFFIWYADGSPISDISNNADFLYL